MSLTHILGVVGDRPDARVPQLSMSEAIVKALDVCSQCMHKTVHQSQLEFEIRLGLIKHEDGTKRWTAQKAGGAATEGEDAKFDSTVDTATFHKLQQLLSDARFEVEHINTCTYIDSRENRRQVYERTGEVKLDHKKLVFKRYIGLKACPFDLKWSGAVETAVLGAFGPPQVKRTKARNSYSHSHHPWIVDFTTTTTTSLIDSFPTKEFLEVEFEIKSEVLQQWMKLIQDLQKTTSFVRALADEMLWILEKCNPELKAASANELQACRDKDVKQRIRDLFGRLAPGGQQTNKYKSDRFFIGAMPVSMSRQHIRDIQSKGYFVTEKTDGVRYLLVVVKDIQNRPTAFLINRSCEVFTMLGGTVTGAMLGEETVLDGELVFNLTYKRQVFIVFDALRIDGESLVQQRFASRYEAIHTRINPRLIRLCSETDNKLENFTYIARKIFVKSNDVSWLFSRVCLEDGERVFRESFKRHHKTDGLIFQPDGPYFDFSSSGRLLKWKYLDTVTVDLEVARSEATGVTLHCSGPDNTTIDCTTQHTLALSDQLRIIADAEVVHGVEVSDFRTIIRLLQEQQLQGKRMIVEVAYEPRFGCWSYRGCRPDKNDPNYVATVFGAYAELAEGISQQELEYRLSCSDRGEDTWEVEVTRSVEVLLSRKRQRTTNGVAKTHH